MIHVDTFLKSPEGAIFLKREYGDKERSTYEIAEELGTYPNKVLRAIKLHKITVRDRKRAQSNAIKKGRHEHPTKGRKRSQDVKRRIGEGVAKRWQDLSEEEREHRSQLARDRWESMTPLQREQFQQNAIDGMGRASREGSRLEHILLTSLQAAGYNCSHHYECILGNESMHLDIWVPSLRLAIEIDGPTHFFPIWGEERLVKTQRADKEKTGLLLSYGYRLLRVKYLLKSLSGYRERLVIEQVLDVLREVESNDSKQYYEVEVTPNDGNRREETPPANAKKQGKAKK